MTHGTHYAYQNGCRCDKCRSVQAAYKRRRRAHGKATGARWYVNDLAASKVRKDGYRGTCRECGRATSGCNGPGTAPTLCNACRNRETSFARRGQGPTVGKVISFLAEEHRFMEVVEHLGGNKGLTSQVLHRLRSYGLVERVGRGRYKATS